MGVVWVICGPGRGVGKTRLAQRLCEVLPDSVYAKCGSGRRQAGKPANFFRTRDELHAFVRARRQDRGHLVIESNALAREGGGDVVVFVAGYAAGGDVRKDARLLRRRARLVVDRNATPRGWNRALAGKLRSAALREAVCDVLDEHRQRQRRAGLAAQCKVWLVRGESYAFGSGLARLLEYVDRCGTLRAAAEAAQMSYRYAWDRIRRAEKHLGWPLIVRESGGRGGGRSRLSPRGRQLLDVFNRTERDVLAFAAERFAELAERSG